jgi:hypothetical protein
MQAQPAAIEDPPQQVLFQVDLFDGAQLQLVRGAPDEPTFENEPLVGDADLGGPKRQHDRAEEPGSQKQKAERHIRVPPGVSRYRPRQRPEQQQPGTGRIKPGEMSAISRASLRPGLCSI